MNATSYLHWGLIIVFPVLAFTRAELSFPQRIIALISESCSCFPL